MARQRQGVARRRRDRGAAVARVLRLALTGAVGLLPAASATAADGRHRFDTVLHGASCYHEYMPYERLEEDARLMEEAGVSVVRVGESTWTSWEPRDGEFRPPPPIRDVVRMPVDDEGREIEPQPA
jgi:beta-galactosidase